MSNVVVCLFSASGYDRAAQGVAGAGRRLADSLGAKMHIVAIGPSNPDFNSQAAAVADSVIVADQAELSEYQPEICLEALKQLCRPLEPRAVILSNDTWSQELAPRLAHRLGGSAAGDCLDLTVVDGSIRIKRSVYGGKAVATIELKRSPAVAWVRSRAFDPAALAASTGEIKHASAEIKPDDRTRIVERKSETSGEARLEDAKLIISGGRGLGGPEPFKDLQEVAAMLGGQVGASRAACDSGWCPPSWQIGQTGKKVAPGLYLAVAIQGASQHIAGMSDSKVVAAVNIDPDAPIFKHCKFGIVEDYKKVIPLLKEKLAAMK
ncbi:MAG: electron transfer flavoprotein subunit alpha/FixB family protein [Acidobacteria bacterium]|nr:electron transfer flavoprotein subunit alpha/FixB family protein [Acidobacteriota bacterium]MBK8314663.1 electron transfer flavoprotein subunit alpha/FixB family protein [Acidobacteriota bacterium]MBK9708735.1 electron transfer flavoprotein subunit alpha/FixB family protein [Acidobacteriota bacterium]